MTKSKVISTLTFLINAGIGQTLYYACGDSKHDKLRTAKAFWNEDKNICFEIEGKVYQFKLIEDN